MAAARFAYDIGKAAFRPAWASTMTDVAAKDPPRKGRRLGTLDAMQEIGEIAGFVRHTLADWRSIRFVRGMNCNCDRR